MRKKALLVVTSVDRMDNGEETGFWLSELTHPYFAMADEGIDVDIVSIRGGKAPVDPRSYDMEDPYNKRFLEDEKLKNILEDTGRLRDVKLGEYDAVVYAGGHGTMWDFPEGEGVHEVSLDIYVRDGVVAAICHGPAALVNLRDDCGGYLIKGRRIAAFTNKEEEIVGQREVVPFSLEDRLKSCGCEYIEGEEWSENVQCDGRIVTGQNPQSAMKVGRMVAELLKA